ncbi:hypothetical protein [Chitinimonas koreensis]|uniref:hypothetical protein n=1 Tax=Chitinimonas koreensis TaxID=356302 RepID=UPI0012FC4652|nr:hypothetical protein [Chitinimonas koreensis]QNM95512.1 hypothetical protein H9L41_16800 [Chitinimonas koreensis]
MLRAVAEGQTLADAGQLIGKSAGWAGRLLSQACREIGLPSEIRTIRDRKDEYLEKLGEPERNPVDELNSKVAVNLASALRLKGVGELTPVYLSNITASQLLGEDQTPVAVAEAQDWLVRHGTSLRRKPPESEMEMREVRRAIAILDAFHFDVAHLRAQYEHLQCND